MFRKIIDAEQSVNLATSNGEHVIVRMLIKWTFTL
jgi:hypothetical protein